MDVLESDPLGVVGGYPPSQPQDEGKASGRPAASDVVLGEAPHVSRTATVSSACLPSAGPADSPAWPVPEPTAISAAASLPVASVVASTGVDWRAIGPAVDRLSLQRQPPTAPPQAPVGRRPSAASARLAPAWGAKEPATELLEGERCLVHEPRVLIKGNSDDDAVDGELFVTTLRLIVEAPGDSSTAVRSTWIYVGAVVRMREDVAPPRDLLADGSQARDQSVAIFELYGARPALSMALSSVALDKLHSALRKLKEPMPVFESCAFAVGGGHHTVRVRGRDLSPGVDGWTVYSYHAEFHRQGLLNPLSCWRVTEANVNYALCPSYPPHVVVPKVVTDAMLDASAAFRASRRLPALCWKDPQSFASISRAGQPLVGLNGKRCREDELLLAALRDTNPESETLAIVDCRPRLNAEANVLGGKGYEHASNYPGTVLSFVDIQNIHAMRESIRKLLRALQADESSAGDFLREVQSSGWLDHIQHILRGAVSVAALIEGRTSVLVHCSDGWDRTSQLTSIAQLLLDPHFRTVRGFVELVEKVRGHGAQVRAWQLALGLTRPHLHQEWLSFGHQFALRLGANLYASVLPAPGETSNSPTPPTPAEDKQSPIFVQFIDAVWQLGVIRPRAFEWSQAFLAAILRHLQSGRFGTFLLNSHAQRTQAGLAKQTHSLWSDLLTEPAARGFVNPRYERVPGVLRVDVSGSRLSIWRAYYCRGSHALDPENPLVAAEAALAEVAFARG